ncbi:metal ion ABC transporter periplasmic protein [Parageobacillus genomosp. 1]|uniref:Metal ion ABC transporter periplasmic protein n=1 Tax=Parageobacillus genomosp. 1 TaxID=1295642 RepID=A0ABC9VE01_9BACL|nr:zinc ABC transporter substrate-binding protein [Parageobacillus genomosp. 1]EZP76570.1 metal ion ABC transporter periplasmic protein [Parageobacillus genomosp. 1]
MKIKSLLLSLLLVISGLLYGCSGETKEQQGKKEKDVLTIYTTVYPLQDFTEKIGGKYVHVQSIYPPGVEAHTFEPSTKTMKQLADADAFIYIGQGMEGFADKVKETLKNERVHFLAATEGIGLLDSTHEEHEDEHEHHGDKDPHVWLDPIRSITMAENIRDLLIELKPEEKETFMKNFEILKAKLENLDRQFQMVVDQSPKKEILVAHAAYGYWEDRYGIKQLSVSGLSPTNEPSQKELAEIINKAKQHHIKYVIFEQNITQKIANIVQKEIGADSLRLHNLESRTSKDVKENKDYFALMEDNIRVLQKALQ